MSTLNVEGIRSRSRSSPQVHREAISRRAEFNHTTRGETGGSVAPRGAGYVEPMDEGDSEFVFDWWPASQGSSLKRFEGSN